MKLRRWRGDCIFADTTCFDSNIRNCIGQDEVDDLVHIQCLIINVNYRHDTIESDHRLEQRVDVCGKRYYARVDQYECVHRLEERVEVLAIDDLGLYPFRIFADADTPHNYDGEEETSIFYSSEPLRVLRIRQQRYNHNGMLENYRQKCRTNTKVAACIRQQASHPNSTADYDRHATTSSHTIS